jgi:DNA-directed RNA polymerase II subunit RPB1
MSKITKPDTKIVSGIQFSISSPDEIRRTSVVEVTKTDTYEKDNPVIKGLFDPRMGITETGKICSTCGQNNISCPGHFGHIELARPIYNYHFIKHVEKILKCVCFKCSKLLIDKDSEIMKSTLSKNNKYKWSKTYSMCSKIKVCGQETIDGCGCKQPSTYKIDGISGIKASWKNDDNEESGKKTIIIDAELAKQILEKITDEDCNYLGLSSSWCRPEWLICTVLPVPPPSVRPSVQQDNSQRMDDDLTHKLSEIVKYNNDLRNKIEKNNSPDIISDWTNILQYHVATMIDNQIPQVSPATHRSGRPLKAIVERLKGKEGRIRNNLMGKRVDFSARSVITPDSQIELDQLGVPIKIAMNLSVPEKVNSFNYKKLLELVRTGPEKWPGANNIIKKNNTRITLIEGILETVELEIGDTVSRHLLDGDPVLFNRQPSLHKMSMMAHRVKVMKGNTFRLNVSVTPPYNADFDGDEMNMHVPQSLAAMCELINIANVKQQLISPRENKPIITIVQDTLMGIHKLTAYEHLYFKKGNKIMMSSNTNIYDVKGDTNKKLVPSTLMTKKQTMNILSQLSTFRGTIPESDYNVKLGDKTCEFWTGKSILSFILPEIININSPNSNYDNIPIDEKNIIKITSGIIQQGTFDKDIFTKTSVGLIHTICNDMGTERAKDFIDDLQKIITFFILNEGFSVGISDMIPDKDTTEKMKDIITKKKKEIDETMQEIHLNIFENMTGQSNKEHFEGKVNALLNETINQTGKIGLSTLDEKNRLTTMVNSGSKGKPTNISQMIACLGQQNVDGSRIPYGFTDRTLPHYHKYDDSAEARGFVENSFISGQTPQEFFFHAQGGREGLIDTAVKTSQTGYIQRKLIKAMEDLKVGYDYTVRDSSGSVVQYVYGDDAVNPIYMESQPLILMKLPFKKSEGQKEDIHDVFYYGSETDWKRVINHGRTLIRFKKVKDYQKQLDKSFKRIIEHRNYLFYEIFNQEPDNNIIFPVHIKRITENICGKENSIKRYTDIHPIDILKMNETLKKSISINTINSSSRILHILIDIHLSPKILINKYSVTRQLYEQISLLIKQQYYKSIIHPGEMVGPVSAQSIGEPATQMTLNTFHFAGVSAKSNVTRGIPRLRELLHVTKNIKAPSDTIYLHREYAVDKNKAQFIKNKLEFTRFRDIVLTCKIYYEPNNNSTLVEEDVGLVKLYKMFKDFENEDIEFIPWIIRFTFDKEKMMDSGLVMEDINFMFLKWAELGDEIDRIKFVYSDDNAKELVGRLSIATNDEDEYINGISDQSDIISSLKDITEEFMNENIVKGIHGILNIVMSQDTVSIMKDNEITTEKLWKLETDGTNLLSIMNCDYVDELKSFSNDVNEIYSLLGIEATRNHLIGQMVEVFDEYINMRHINLLCEVMTCRGSLVSIDRHGINSGDTGPLAKCSFEDTTDQLIKAGIFGERDKLQGVSSNIMMGQIIPAGTGLCDILLDEEKLMNELSSLDEDEEYEIDEDNIEVIMNTEEDNNCSLDDLKMSYEY